MPQPLPPIDPSLDPEPMDAVDRAWLRMDHPTNLMVINGLILFHGPLDFERVREVIENRLLSIPRFRKRIVGPEIIARRHHWAIDEDFDISDHLVHNRLPEGAGEEDLREFVSRRMGEPLPYDEPLWRCYVIDGPGERSAMLWRLHHCIGDGIALMMVLLSLTDLEPDSDEDAVGSEPNPLAALLRDREIDSATALGHLEKVLPEGARLMAGPSEALMKANDWLVRAACVPAFGRLCLRGSDPKTPFKGELGVEKRVAWSEAVSLPRVKEIGKAAGGTVNDVLLTAMAGGLRRYLDRHDFPLDGLSFRGVIPVSLRPLEEMSNLGNRFGLVFLSLPVGIGDIRDRMIELRRRMSSLKRSVEPLVVMRILAAIGLSPKAIQDLVVKIFGTKATAVMTNVPGPAKTIYFAGRPIDGLLFWVPQSGRLGMGISIASYADEVRIGIATDAGLVERPGAIVEGFNEDLDEMDGLF